jgi:hypothetical protein
MAGQTYTKLEVGDRCIIHVDDVNRPTGWWWGIVDSFEWNDDHHGGWGKVGAHTTGPFQFEITPGFPNGDSRRPVYGESNQMPYVNYIVYPASRDTAQLVRSIIRGEEHYKGELHNLKIRNDELRSVIEGMSLTPEKIVEAVREAVAKPE